MTLWLPYAKRNPGRSSGAYAAGYELKVVVHTTESATFTPRSDSYFGHSGWPHLTTERDGTLWQHVDLDVASRALKNHRGGVETNRGGAVQIENCGFARDGDRALTDAQVATVSRVIADLQRLRGLGTATLPAGAIPNSARADAPQRMTGDEWRNFNGVCGHRHVPENDHWDPGAFDLSRLVTATPTPLPPFSSEEDDMPQLEKAGDDIFYVSGVAAQHVRPSTVDYLIRERGMEPPGEPWDRDAFFDAHQVRYTDAPT